MTLGREYFDALYQRRADPWRLAERWYEERKRAMTLASLPHPRYEMALEVGCSIGTLTEVLAARCDRLVATDISAQAIEIARERLGDNESVELLVSDATGDLPPGTFSLIVLSEVGYYLAPEEFGSLLDRCVARLHEDGVLLACHWRHPVSDYPMRGDEVHDMIRARPELDRLGEYVDDDFRLELFQLGRARSVALREGLA